MPFYIIYMSRTYIDLDGVLDDFDLWLATKIGHVTHEPEEAYEVMVKYADECFLDTKVITHTDAYFDMLKKDPNCYVLSALSLPENLAPYCKDRTPEEICKIHKKNKIQWAVNHGIPREKVIICRCAEDKINYCKPGDILYDDRRDTIKKWNDLGGIGIHVYNPYWG